MKLFFRAYLQTTLAAISTVLILKQLILGILIVNFILSLVCTFNLSKLSLSSTKEKIIFSLGAGIGSTCGVLIIGYFF